MIKCNLARYMSNQKMNISDVARQSGLNRSTISLLYNEKATRVELNAIETLCNMFKCKLGDFLEIKDEEGK
jgi:putative transcriptional regulator